MYLSDISIKRPVFASVISLLLIAFGLVSFDRLSLREYPDIDPPVVSIETNYQGASANVVETRITKIIEDRIAGIEGISFIQSSSEDGRSRITIEFNTGVDIDSAANDIRDRVSRIADDLPDEADPPEIQKEDSNEDVIVWFNLTGEGMTVPELTDYADRYLVDRFSVLDGVARVQIGGQQLYAMRVWIDRNELAARGLTANDIEAALRAENIELPAGNIESSMTQFTIRVERAFRSPDDFKKLVLGRGEDGYLIRLGDIARVEKGTVEDRTLFRGNGIPQVGIGIIKQSTANTIDVARAAQAEARRIDKTMPEGMSIEDSYDTSVFVEGAIKEVYMTLGIAIGLVILIMYLFLGSVRAMLVPAVTVPVSVIATFTVLWVLGFSINLLTLLALVLAIGLVVDDAIVVLENIVRRMEEKKEPPLLAAFRGTRQVGFAVIATTLVLIAVFVPISFLEGDIGRLFSEFALTIAAAVGFSSLVALTLSAMLASQFLKQNEKKNAAVLKIEYFFDRLRNRYKTLLIRVLRWPVVILGVFTFIIGGSYFLITAIPSEFAPKEDRGAFFVMVSGPEGASYAYMKDYMDEIEKRLMPYTESGEIQRLLVRAPRSFGNIASFNSGIIICVLNDWAERRNAFEIMDEVAGKISDLPGVRAFPVMRQGFGGGTSKPLQFVIGGGTYEELARWRDIVVQKVNENNPGLVGLDWDYKETKPQLRVNIDYDRAAELGVTVGSIGRTLETMLGSKRVTTYIDQGEEYDVILEGERDTQRTPTNMQNIYVRSDRTGELIPLSNLVSVQEVAESSTLNRFNRIRAITIEANLADGYALGEAVAFMENLVREHLPDSAVIDYKGQTRDFVMSGDSIIFVFILGLLVTFLVLAAQFESYVHPFIIMLTVPLAIAGGLLGLYLTDGTLNIYSQIGLIMLVGLAAKNGILIVEFANQLRDEGYDFDEALVEAASIRLRPILMTAITTVAGAVPLVMAAGPGAETRITIGVVVIAGIISATVFTIFIVPMVYRLIGRYTTSPQAVSQRLERQERETPE